MKMTEKINSPEMELVMACLWYRGERVKMTEKINSPEMELVLVCLWYGGERVKMTEKINSPEMEPGSGLSVIRRRESEDD